MAKADRGIVVTLEGDKALKRTLGNMAMAGTKKFVQDSMREVTKPGIAKVKGNTEVGPTGNLKRSIGYKNVRGSGPLVYSAIVGARMGRFRSKNPNSKSYNSGFHAHLYAFSHMAWGKFRTKGAGDWIYKGMDSTRSLMASRLSSKWTKILTRIGKKF